MSITNCWLAALAVAASAAIAPATVVPATAGAAPPAGSHAAGSAGAPANAPHSAAPAAAAVRDTASLAAQVRDAETAFAKSMADRDHTAFVSHLSDEAVFFGGGVLRGKAAVAEAWKRFYEGPAAPFSWQAEKVEVLDSGTLGISSGPVFDPGGKRVGTFNSIWRREADGRWKIIFDNGCPPCDCGGKAGAD